MREGEMGNLKLRLQKKKIKEFNKEVFQKDVMLEKAEEGNEKNQSENKRKRKRKKGTDGVASKAGHVRKDKLIKLEGEKEESRPGKSKQKNEFRKNAPVGNSEQLKAEAGDSIEKQNGKSKKSKKKKKECYALKDYENTPEKRVEADEDEVYCISSGDEDCSKGMKKWLAEYHQNRPGLKVLQQRIDDFITAHEVKLEQERKEREALAAEGGWTVVAHHKGRKKTVDSESGISVGSAAQVSVGDLMAKKKRKEVGLNFYRFQRRDAKRKELLALQSKFEQDRKRIQQLRAARKFQPY